MREIVQQLDGNKPSKDTVVRQLPIAVTGLVLAVLIPAAFAGRTDVPAESIDRMADACREFLASAEFSSSFSSDSSASESEEMSESSWSSSESRSSSHSFESCDPFVCADGTTRPSCTPDGMPIRHIVDPCFVTNEHNCGNGVCEAGEGPTIDPASILACGRSNRPCPVRIIPGSCPEDCGFASSAPATSYCGDGVCGVIFCRGLQCPIQENAQNCPVDCSQQSFSVCPCRSAFADCRDCPPLREAPFLLPEPAR